MVGFFDQDENKAIICGGNKGRQVPCYEYLLEHDEWKIVRSSITRHFAAAVMLSNGSFLVVGGQNRYTMQYPMNEKHGPALPYQAWMHCLCLLDQDHLFMAGGAYHETQAYSLSLITGEWKSLPNMIEPRRSHICHPIKKGIEVLAVGGLGKSSAEVFSFETLCWRLIQPLPREVGFSRVAIQYKDTFLIVGGMYYIDSDQRPSDAIYQFVPSDYSWIKRSERLGMGRWDHLSLPLKLGWEEKAKVCN